MGEGRTTGDASPSNHRLTVPQAAAHLGMTEAAVRGRIKRGTLGSERASGTVYVLLEGDAPPTNRDEPHGEPTDQSELVEELRARVAFLERELERRGDEANTLHRIVAGLTQANTTLAARMPELEAPQEAPEDAETVEEAPEASEPRFDAPGPQEAVQRSWWRRMFGG